MAVQTGFHKLPQEVIDAIVDHLRGDKGTLRRSSLVSHAWLERSQFHLFSSVRVLDGDPSHWHFRHNFAAFHRFLQLDASTRFCTQVRMLVIQGDQGSYDFPSRMVLDKALFALILDKLTRLSSLAIYDVRFENAECVVSKRYKLDELILSSVGSHRDPPRSIINFLDMFGHIGRLRASFVDSWYETALDDGKDNPLEHELKSGPLSLTVDSAHVRGWTTVNCLLNILRNTKSTHTLRSLNVECTDRREVISVGEVLRAAGQSLNHVTVDLSIAFRDEQDPLLLASTLNLAHVTDLHTLHICIFPNLVLPLASSIVHMARASACLLHIFSTLPLTTRRITVELGPSDVVHDRFSLIDWEVLAGMQWKRLQDFERLTILLRRGGSSEIATEIKRRLKPLDEDRMLYIRMGTATMIDSRLTDHRLYILQGPEGAVS